MNELQLYEAINLIDDDLILEAQQEEWTSSDAYFVRSTPKWHFAVGAAAAAVAVAVGVIALSNLKISGGLPVDPSVEENSLQGPLSGGVVLSSPLVDDSDITSEPQKPAGEATFLTAPDGTPIYTSEISEVYTGSEESDNKKAITLAEAEQMAQSGVGDFTVKCDGFVFGYVPERAFNRIDNPELFEDRGDSEYFNYIGEELDKNGYGKHSTDFIRIKPGDKFGSLTVKNAYTLFEDMAGGDSLSDIPGAYITDFCVEFEGAQELTGFVEITPKDPHYGECGDLRFYPDGDSSTEFPCIGGVCDFRNGEYYHCSGDNGRGYFGDWWLMLGNMYKVECNTSGLKPGDSFVKVKITLDNVRFASGHQMGGWKVDLKSIEVL